MAIPSITLAVYNTNNAYLQKSMATIIYKMVLPVVKPGNRGKEELNHNWRAIFHVYATQLPDNLPRIGIHYGFGVDFLPPVMLFRSLLILKS